MDFQGKIALVTGASSGMGAETARLLSDGGARVLGAQRGRAAFEAIAVDFADPSSPEKTIEHIAKATGQLDILINNAGVMREGTVEETSLDDWQPDADQPDSTVPVNPLCHAAVARRTRGNCECGFD